MHLCIIIWCKTTDKINFQGSFSRYRCQALEFGDERLNVLKEIKWIENVFSVYMCNSTLEKQIDMNIGSEIETRSPSYDRSWQRGHITFHPVIHPIFNIFYSNIEVVRNC